MSSVAKLTASFLLAAALAAAAVIGLGAPASAATDDPQTRPAYGETVPVSGSDTVKIGLAVLTGVIGAGLIGYAVMPGSRQPVRVRNDD